MRKIRRLKLIFGLLFVTLMVLAASVSHASLVEDIDIDSIKISDRWRLIFGNSIGLPLDAQYIVISRIESYPGAVSFAKTISPTGLEAPLLDDGNIPDGRFIDGEYSGWIIYSGLPEVGIWKIEYSLGGQSYSSPLSVDLHTMEPAIILQPVDGAVNVSLTPYIFWQMPQTSRLANLFTIHIFKDVGENIDARYDIFSHEIEDDPNANTFQVPEGILEPGTKYCIWLEADWDGEAVGYLGWQASSFTTKPDAYAKFSATPTTGAMPLSVSFTDQSVGTNLTWSWDFGDGSTSAEQNPTHAYTQTGTYTVSLTVTGTEGTFNAVETDFINVYEVGATILNPPEPFDKNKAYAINVSGLDVTAYKYKLDNALSWSSEQPIETPITFTLAAEGAHTLTVIGKNSEGKWQTEQNATTVNWTADFTGPTVSVASPEEGSVVDQINTITAVASDGVSGMSSVEFMVTDGFWFISVNEFSGIATLSAGETWIKGKALSGNSWYIPSSNFPWEFGKNYTITARAADKAGNTARDSVYVAFHDLNNDPAWTTLFLDLSSQTILNTEAVEVSGKLTRLPGGDPPVNLSGLDLVLTVTGPDQSVFQRTVSTYDATGHFELVGENALTGFTEKGVYTLQAAFAGTASLYKAASLKKPILVGAKAGYAVIVEGKIPIAEGLLSHNKTANRVYDKLLERGFLPDNIYYFNYNDAQDGVDDTPEKDKVKNIIEAWIHPKMNASPAPAYFIFIDHGNRNAFHIDNESVSPADVNAWLGAMEENLSAEALNEKRIIIMGACYSGTFIPELSAEGRVIITSAAGDEESFKGPLEPDGIRSGEFFLEELFQQLGRGQSIKDAFEVAVHQTGVYTRKGGSDVNSFNAHFDQAMQHPLLDDNGDRRGSNALSAAGGDGRISADIYLGAGISYDFNSDENPADILSVTPTQYLNIGETSATLWAKSNDDAQVGSAWYEVRNPSKVLVSAGGSGQLEIELDKQLMTHVNNRWEKDHSLFSQSGKYEVFYFVKDAITDEVSPMKRSVVYKAKEGNQAPGPFSLTAPLNIGHPEYKDPKTVLIFDWQEAPDPDAGDTVTYNLVIATDSLFADEVIRKEEISSSFTYLEYSDGLKDLTTYYWKVEAVDFYGARTSSPVWSFKTNNTNVLPFILYGTIYNGRDYSPIADAAIASTIGGVSAASNERGEYIMLIPEGTGSVYAMKTGFNDISIAGIQSKPGLAEKVDIMMLAMDSESDVTAPISHAAPAGGTYASAVEATLTCDDGDGSGCLAIYYTTDGSEPTADSTPYTGPIKVSKNTTLKFYARDNTGNAEPVHVETYAIQINKGDLNSDGSVTLEDAIEALRALTGVAALEDINRDADVNEDSRIGFAEIIYILQEISGLR